MTEITSVVCSLDGGKLISQGTENRPVTQYSVCTLHPDFIVVNVVVVMDDYSTLFIAVL